MDPQYALNDPSELLSPSLVIFLPIVRRNLAKMIEMARGADRLRPHVKTHKMPAIIRMYGELGVHKHKCATIAEAEMTAAAGASDILIAFPMVGPSIPRLAELVKNFPETTFRTVVDDADAARALSKGLEGVDRPVPVLIDLDLGMGRTGIAPEDADDLAALVASLPNLTFDGLHGYDGHIHDFDLEDRKKSAAPGIERTLQLRERLLARGLPVNRLVMGGTPTFPVHTLRDIPGLECSPGTPVLHDGSYAKKYPDLPFVPAALLLGRIVSRPRPDRLCLDIGYKAVAADPQGDRLQVLSVPESTLGGQSEEHILVNTPDAGQFPPGTPVLTLPTHICPTCALHRKAYVIEDGAVVDEWDIVARDRVLRF